MQVNVGLQKLYGAQSACQRKRDKNGYEAKKETTEINESKMVRFKNNTLAIQNSSNNSSQTYERKRKMFIRIKEKRKIKQ